jgi:hypothetical protein
MKRTFLDAGVLIAAARGNEELASRAMAAFSAAKRLRNQVSTGSSRNWTAPSRTMSGRPRSARS